MNTKNRGIIIAATIYCLWALGLVIQFYFTPSWPIIILSIALQTHLFTGIFITAHDAMHGTVHSNKKINNLIGWLCTLSYAMFSYNKLYTKHHLHHKEVHTHNDPDYHSGSFLAWYFSFMKNYVTITQIILMAIVFNVFKLFIPWQLLILYWIVPAVFSTFQLFIFGTYLPHKGEHQNIHQARSQQKNHWIAFISCYFFGYHFEHHDKPWVPWWKLYQHKQ